MTACWGASKEQLYDVTEAVRTEMGEEGIAGVHGDRNELEMLLHSLLKWAVYDSTEERCSGVRYLCYDYGYEVLVFFFCYEDDLDYVEGFV